MLFICRKFLVVCKIVIQPHHNCFYIGIEKYCYSDIHNKKIENIYILSNLC